MGHDFMFMHLNSRSERHFPLSCAGLTEADVDGSIPWSALRSWLIAGGGRENGHADSIWVEYEDGGSINFNGKPESVYLDVHSEWKNVLEAYDVLLSHEPNSVIFDLQPGEFHDKASFREILAKE